MRVAFKISLISVLILAVLSISVPCFADGITRKLGRGLANMATGFLEVPDNIVRVSEKDGWLAGITFGTMKGLAWAIVRTAVGAYETVTFFAPVPSGYEPILEPEFLFGEEF